jgi:WD40 repeat protein
MRQRLLPYDARSLICLAWRPDGQALLLGLVDGTVRVWDTATGLERACLRAHAGMVNALLVSPSGDRLITGGSDGRVYEWDLGSLDKAPTVILQLQSPVVALARSPDGVVAATDGRQVVRTDGQEHARSPIPLDRLMWLAPGFLMGAGESLVRLHEDEPFVTEEGWRVLSFATFREPRQTLVGLASGEVVDLETASNKPVARAGEEVVCWSEPLPGCYGLLAAGTGGGRILVHLHGYSGDPTRPFTSWKAHDGPVTALACAPDGFELVSAGADGRIVLWTQGQRATIELSRTDWSYWVGLDVSPTAQIAIVGDAWVVVPGGPSFEVDDPMWNGVGAAAWAPDGSLVTVDDGKTWVRRFDRSGTPLADVFLDDATGRGLAVAGDGRIAVSNARGIVLLDTSLREIGRLAPGHDIVALAWSRAGALAAMESSGLLTVWAPSTGQELLVWQDQERSELGQVLSWSPCGRWLAVAGWAAGVFDLATQQLILPLPRATSVAFSPDGRWLAVGSPSVVATVWDWPRREPAAWWSIVPDNRGSPMVGWRQADELVIFWGKALTSWSVSPYGEG